MCLFLLFVDDNGKILPLLFILYDGSIADGDFFFKTGFSVKFVALFIEFFELLFLSSLICLFLFNIENFPVVFKGCEISSSNAK